MRVVYFASPADFRRWLQANHRTATELWVGFYKKATGRPTITWSEAVDEALCFGWIDGVRRSVDAASYTNRFTPRRKNSVWSAVNTRRAEELIRRRRMRAAGLQAFAARDAERTARFVRETAAFAPRDEAAFRRNRAAWSFFRSQPPGYQRLAVRFVMSAKQDATRARRLERLIADSAAGRRIGP